MKEAASVGGLIFFCFFHRILLRLSRRDPPLEGRLNVIEGSAQFLQAFKVGVSRNLCPPVGLQHNLELVFPLSPGAPGIDARKIAY
jgi:hypothetical protein